MYFVEEKVLEIWFAEYNSICIEIKISNILVEKVNYYDFIYIYTMNFYYEGVSGRKLIVL